VPGGNVEAFMVVAQPAIDATTTEAAIGLPVTCHRAVGKYAAVLALSTPGQKRDPTNAMKLYERELDQLERIYGEFDTNAGFSLREALMESASAEYGDTFN